MELYYDNKKSQMQILRNANDIKYDIKIKKRIIII